MNWHMLGLRKRLLHAVGSVASANRITCILEAIIRHREARAAMLTAAEKQWLGEAKLALAVPEELAKSMTNYSRNLVVLYACRDHIGTLLDRSGAAGVNPWGKTFGVRGFAAPQR